MNRRRAGWLLMFPVLLGALFVGLRDDGEERTAEERVQDIGSSIACPTCAGQSVADSDAAAAQNIRRYIAGRVSEDHEDGAADVADDDIRNEVAARFDESLLLTPDRTGVGALVWVLPPVALALAATGIGFAFHHWRRSGRGRGDDVQASPADRLLVEQAMGQPRPEA